MQFIELVIYLSNTIEYSKERKPKKYLQAY